MGYRLRVPKMCTWHPRFRDNLETKIWETRFTGLQSFDGAGVQRAMSNLRVCGAVCTFRAVLVGHWWVLVGASW